MSEIEEKDPRVIAALVREGKAYVARGLNDRAEQVKEQLRLRGYGTDGKPLAGKDAPEGRSSQPPNKQQT